MFTQRIKEIQNEHGFLFWLSILGSDLSLDFSRCTAFQVTEKDDSITVFLPHLMAKRIQKTLTQDSRVSFLMASFSNFESYQVKGEILNLEILEENHLQEGVKRLKKTIQEITQLKLDGQSILGYLTNGPFMAVKIGNIELFEQTPKKGTGNKISG